MNGAISSEEIQRFMEMNPELTMRFLGALDELGVTEEGEMDVD